MTETKIIRYEDSAEVRTLTGWCCTACNYFWGQDEHMAKYCCATDHPCGRCETGRASQHHAYCRSCEETRTLERYLALPEVEWNGTDALTLFDGAQYFFSPDDLDGYLDWDKATKEPVNLEDVRLQICERVTPSEFCLAEHYQDEIAEDYAEDYWSADIDKQVNEWLAENFPQTWQPTKYRPSLASLRAALGLTAEPVTQDATAPQSSEAA